MENKSVGYGKWEVKSVGYGEWELIYNDVVVGEIRTFNGFRRKTKSLYVNDEKICEVKNQNEAIEKLNEFFADVKQEIKVKEDLIEQLTVGIEQVSHQVCIDALMEKREKLIGELEELKLYDLI